MMAKRSISIPLPVDQWLRQEAEKRGMSVSALLSHFVMVLIEEQKQI
jgi:hypothetical protein